MVLRIRTFLTERNLPLVPTLDAVAREISDLSCEDAIEIAQQEILMLDELAFDEDLPPDMDDKDPYTIDDLLPGD